jgi:hypothetical protein
MNEPKMPPKASKHEKKKIEDYEVENAFNDMLRVEKHKENPELMKKVHAHAGRHMKAVKGIKSIQDLRDISNEMQEKGEKTEL